MKAALILWILRAASGQVKLNFRGNHREEPVLMETSQNVLQYHPWLKRARFAVALFHGQQDLRVMLRVLRTGAQGTADGNSEPVGLIIKRGGYVAFMVHGVDGEGEVTAFFQI